MVEAREAYVDGNFGCADGWGWRRGRACSLAASPSAPFFGGQMRLTLSRSYSARRSAYLAIMRPRCNCRLIFTGFGQVLLLDRLRARESRRPELGRCIRSLGACRKVRKMSS